MGVNGAWDHFADKGQKVISWPAALEAASRDDPRISKSSNATLLVDGGALYTQYIDCLKTEVKRTDHRLFQDEDFDFVSNIRQRASTLFHRRIEKYVRSFIVPRLGVKKAIICWDNSGVSPIAKGQEQAKRHTKQRNDDEQALREALCDILTTSKEDNDINNKLDRLAAKAGTLCFGPAIPPSNVIYEDSPGFNWRAVNARKEIISHVVARDEADLTIARAELQLDQMMVFTHDCDLLFLVNCIVIRRIPIKKKGPPKGTTESIYEVIKGQRSSEAIVLGQVSGQDYTCSVGLYRQAFKTFAKFIKDVEGIEEMDAMTLFEAAKEVAENSGKVFDKKQVQSVRRGIQIWLERSHGSQIVKRISLIPTHTALRQWALNSNDVEIDPWMLEGAGTGVEGSNKELLNVSEELSKEKKPVGETKLNRGSNIDKTIDLLVSEQTIEHELDMLSKFAQNDVDTMSPTAVANLSRRLRSARI